MYDLIIRGDRVVTPHGVAEADLGIRGGRIAAVAEAGSLRDAGRLIDARGKIVMPGGIDPHVHCAWHIPAIEGGEAQFTGPPATVSRAALFGGTTTMIDFAAWEPGETIAETVEKRDRTWAGQCYCDYAYHIMLRDRVPPERLEELGRFIDAGYPTVKIFTTDITPSRRGRMIRFGDIWEIFKVIAAHRGLGVIHAEDDDIVMHMYDKLIAENRAEFENMAEVHNALSEELSFRRVIRLAENVPGTALYMMHTSAASGVEAVAESRARGFPIYGETLHQYLMFTSEDYRRPNGQIYHTYPSLKSKADQRALWAGLRDDVLHTVATDEICCTLAVKVQGRRIDDTTGGNAGVEPRLAVMYTQMVTERGWPLETFVDLTSTNAAKLMGLYPRKGALAVGADADVTVLDPNEARTVRNEDLHESDYTPWEGHAVSAWPATTILRGKVMVEDGQFHGDLADGQYLKREIPDWVHARRTARGSSVPDDGSGGGANHDPLPGRRARRADASGSGRPAGWNRGSGNGAERAAGGGLRPRRDLIGHPPAPQGPGPGARAAHVADRALLRRTLATAPASGPRTRANVARRRVVGRTCARLASGPRRAVRRAPPGCRLARGTARDVRHGRRRTAAHRDDPGRRAVPDGARARPRCARTALSGGGSRASGSPGTVTEGTASRCTAIGSGGASRTPSSRSSPSARRGDFC